MKRLTSSETGVVPFTLLLAISLLAWPIKLDAKAAGTTNVYCDCSDWDYQCGGPVTDDPPPCSTASEPEPSPSIPTETTPPYSTITPSTPPPPGMVTPKFTKNLYQTSVPAWPIPAGSILRPGMEAGTPFQHPISYRLGSGSSSSDLIRLVPGTANTQDIVFTRTVAEGAFVGPNNVMLLEVLATVNGTDGGSGAGTGVAVVAIVFPKPTRGRLMDFKK